MRKAARRGALWKGHLSWRFFHFTGKEVKHTETGTDHRFTDAEMEIARETDLPDLLEHLGYQIRRVGSYHTTKEMDSLRIKTAAHGSATPSRQGEMRSHSSNGSATRASGRQWNTYWPSMGDPETPLPSRALRTSPRQNRSPFPCPLQMQITAVYLPISKKRHRTTGDPCISQLRPAV